MIGKQENCHSCTVMEGEASIESSVKLNTAVTIMTTVANSDREGETGENERDWAREKQMKVLLTATRGLLLHFPDSCRFNNSSSRDEDDWNTYVRAY